jgi:hypothetical protein
VSQADEEDSLLPPDQEAELLAALEAALRPSQLEPGVNERLIEMALEDPLAQATEAELIESARLRDALADGTPHADTGLLRALGAPFQAPGDGEDAQAAERAVDRALGRRSQATPRRRSNVVYAVFGGASAVLAAAAAVALLVVQTRSAEPVAAAPAGLVKPHSTTALFAERFETGDTTARMDRIAGARSRDLRDNRYASWGVR